MIELFGVINNKMSYTVSDIKFCCHANENSYLVNMCLNVYYVFLFIV